MEDIHNLKQLVKELETNVNQLESRIMDLSGKGIITTLTHWQNTSLKNIIEKVDGISYTEEWRDAAGYEGLYQVSSYGRIKSFFIKRKIGVIIMKQYVRKHGYIRVTISKNLKTTCPSVHSLIANTFFGDPPVGYIINHKNGCRHDNRVQNLEYCSISDNIKHSYKIGLSLPMAGEKNGASKLTDNQVLEIYGRNEKQHILGKQFNVDQATISLIKSGKRWSHITNPSKSNHALANALSTSVIDTP